MVNIFNNFKVFMSMVEKNNNKAVGDDDSRPHRRLILITTI